MTPISLEMVLWLQRHATPVLDFLFDSVSFLGEEYFYIGLLGLIYWVFNKKFGTYLGLTLAVSLSLNNVLKDLFTATRPFEDSSEVINKRPDTSTGHAMPSGHTQGSATVFFALAFYLKKRWLFITAILMTIFMMFSRMYLGVHYPEDVLMGALLGFGVAFVLYELYERFHRHTTKLHRMYVIILALFIPFLLFMPGNDLFRSVGILMGFVFAVMFEQRYVNFSITGPIWRRLIRYFLGLTIMLSVLIVSGLVKDISAFSSSIINVIDLIRYFIVAFTGFGLYPWLFKKINL